jgi:hypothetical protein
LWELFAFRLRDPYFLAPGQNEIDFSEITSGVVEKKTYKTAINMA